MVTLAEAEELTGIQQSTIRQRINLCGWSPEKATTTKTRKTNYIEFNGEQLSVHEAARRIGMHHNTLLNRVKKGWPIEAALSMTPLKGQRPKASTK